MQGPDCITVNKCRVLDERVIDVKDTKSEQNNKQSTVKGGDE